MKTLFFSCSIILGSLCTRAQSHDILWKLLLQTPGQPVFILNPLAYDPAGIHDSLPPNPIKCVPLKNGKELYLFVQGTGRLFRMDFDSSTGAFKPARMDSTRYYGYNYQAYPFSYKGALYNLGGYGFWRRNGLLRKFNESVHQWDIVPLNREVPVIIYDRGDLIWLNGPEGKIVVAGHKELNDGLKNRIQNEDKMLELDLQTGDWTEKGRLADYIKNIPSENARLIALGKTGLLFRISYDDFIFLSFSENKVHKIEGRVWDHFSFKNNEIRDFINFFIDSTLYSYNALNGHLDQYTLTTADFIDLHQPIYVSENAVYLT